MMRYEQTYKALVMATNLLGEELQVENVGIMAFALDHNFVIQIFHHDRAVNTFKNVITQSFECILSDESFAAWNLLKKRLLHDAQQSYYVELVFRSVSMFTIPTFCYAMQLSDDYYVLVAAETILPNKVQEEVLTARIHDLCYQMDGLSSDRHFDIPAHEKEIIKQVRKYIIYAVHHPEMEILSMPAMAHHFGIHEMKLKRYFRMLYKTSVFKFYVQERLSKACYLLVNTDMPVRDIAERVKFVSLPHFSKAFKSRYAIQPSEYRRRYGYTTAN